MLRAQSGITEEANTDALFITLTIDLNSDQFDAIKKGCSQVPELTDQLSQAFPQARLSSTISIGSRVWPKLCTEAKPENLTAFKEVKDGDRVAPATPGDLLLHIRSNRKDINFQLLRNILRVFGDSVAVEEEVSGFRYLDNRDLTGFVDGTENPKGHDRAVVALVGDEDATFAGGSYIHCQRYIHSLTAWEKQSVSQQETIIGRTKADNIEFSSDQKAPTAHVHKANIKDAHGKGMEILRHSMPYGNAKEAGLLFISYCRTPVHFETMLEAMMKADHHGHYDHLMDYSKAVTGCAFFAPSVDFLQKLVS